MELEPNNSILFREKIQRLSVVELYQILEESKSAIEIQESKQDQHLARLEWLRLRLMIYNDKSCEENLQEFEDLYQNLVSSEPENEEEAIPLKYKAEFLNLFLNIFMSKGGYTRCQLIMKIFKDLFDANPTDDFVAFKYYSAYLSVGTKYMTLSAKTPDEYIGIISEDISARDFPEQVATDLDFSQKFMIADFYISRNTTKWISVCDELLDICKSTKLLVYMRDLVLHNVDNFGKTDKGLKDRAELMISLVEQELKTHPESELAESQIALNLVKMMQMLDKKETERLIESAKALESLLSHHKLEKWSTLYYQIACCMYSFILDPDSVDQGKIFSFSRDVEKLVDESTYETNYYSLESFGVFAFFEEAMGVQVNYKVSKKYADTINKDKLTFISFMGSFSIIKDVCLKPYVETALEYCEELGIDKLHLFKVNLDFVNNYLALLLPGVSKPEEVLSNFDSLAELYEENRNTMIDEKLEMIYSMQLSLAEGLNYTDKYVTIAQKFLATKKIVTESFDSIYVNTINILLNRKDFQLANKVCNDFLNYAKKEGENTKSYHKALSKKLACSMVLNNGQEYLEFSQNYEQITKTVYGANSIEHAHAIKCLAQGKVKMRQYQEAYQSYLNCYDIYKAKFGSEVNSESSTVLTNIAMIKSYWREFEDAENLIKKAKEIEEKYAIIKNGEARINQEKQKAAQEGKLKIGNIYLSKTKVAVTLIGIGLATFGSIYYIKSKKSK
ncbi:unnamed protein product [Moneuplotes crassus]|uniref:Uncharacterized protein n=1 Tax=Euplotes crassus TaxID=5936 RepID=A0AAD2DCJ4_EUPCR|nr:unnamed protein product [Moneuplotes crassus]